MAERDPVVGRALGDRVARVLEEVRRVPREEWEDYIRGRCADDPEALAELLRLAKQRARRPPIAPPPPPEPRSNTPAVGRPTDDTIPLDAMTGRVLADRYELTGILGSGGSGVAYRAADRLLGHEVAVKLFRLDPDVGLSHRRREAATLRLLRLPGVVHLIDEGVEDGVSFVVTRLVEGGPFPHGRHTWESLREPSLALLEILERVHRAGIVHRDLKPGNILVDDGGRPHLLDLGIAQERRLAVRESGPGHRTGTPRYMAPEQIYGEPATVQSDLYALGAVLFEALTREPYRTERSVRLVTLGMRSGLPRPIDGLGDGVPGHVRAMIESLLQEDPIDRPRSAGVVIDGLLARGDDEVDQARTRFVGRDVELHTLVDRVRSGEDVVVAGTEGSGRRRLLREAVRVLEREGYGFQWIGRREVLIAPPPSRGDRSRVSVTDEGPPDAIRLGPLLEADLRGLFAGPDRFLHLREDGARALWDRTGGHPQKVVDTLEAWSRAGLGYWHRALYHVRREDLRDLEREARAAWMPSPAEVSSVPLQDDVALAALAIGVAGTRATRARLALVLGWTPSRVEAVVRELVELGVARGEGETGLRLHVTVPQVEVLRRSVGPDLHAAMAESLPADDEQRLVHWAAAEDDARFLADCVPVAAALRRAGRPEAALRVARRGLRLAATLEESEVACHLLETWLLAALQANDPRDIELVLYECGRVPPSPAVQQVEKVAGGALHVLQREPQRALDEVPLPTGNASARLIEAVLAVRLYAARQLGGEALGQVLSEAESNPATAEVASRHTKGERAWIAYGEGRYEEAASLHLQEGGKRLDPRGRLGSLTDAASAFLEAAKLDEAELVAREAEDEAASQRAPTLEARAAWVARSAAYRRGHVLVPDVRAPLAAEAAGLATTPLIMLTEAAIAWRACRRRTAARLARCAEDRFAGEAKRWSRRLARALALAAESPSSPDETAALLEANRSCPSPRIGMQIAGLLARAHRTIASTAREQARGFAADIPPKDWSLCREVLSVDGAMQSESADV